MKFIAGVCFTLLFIFGIIGAIFVGTVLHEYSHMNDIRSSGIPLQSEKIDIHIPLDWKDLVSPDFASGSYEFTLDYTNKDIKIVDNIKKYTEIKAYAISILFLIIFVACFAYVLLKFDEFSWWQ